MIRTVTIATAFALYLPAIASAQTAPAPAKEKRICKSAASIGTLVQQKTCHTASEWKAIAEANDRSMQQMRQETNPGTNTTPQ